MLRRMRWIWYAAALLATLVSATSLSAKPAAAASFLGVSFSNRGDMNVSFFYQSLEPYGRWYSYSPYGYVWSPMDVPYGWRPYSDGEWVYTDYGWTWVDDEPWGWATMHYGRWVYDEDVGWIWVPGTTWAPAWVAWASTDSWVGWAPLPPDMGWNVGISFNDFDVHRVPSRYWCFVDRRDLTNTDLRARILPVSRNVTILPRVRSVTRFASRDGTPVNVGPDVRTIERFTGRPVPRLRMVDVRQPTHGRLRGNQVQMFRGRFAPAPRNAAPARVNRARGNGRGGMRGTMGAMHRGGVPMNDRGGMPMNGRGMGRERAPMNGADMRGANGREPARMRGRGMSMGRGREMQNPSASAARNQERQRFDLDQAMQNRGPSPGPSSRGWMRQRSPSRPAAMPRPDRGPTVIRDSQGNGPRIERGRYGGQPGSAPSATQRGGGRPERGGGPPASRGNGDRGDRGGGNPSRGNDQSRGNGGHGRGHGDGE